MALYETATEVICRVAFHAAGRAAQGVGFYALASGKKVILLGRVLVGEQDPFARWIPGH